MCVACLYNFYASVFRFQGYETDSPPRNCGTVVVEWSNFDCSRRASLSSTSSLLILRLSVRSSGRATINVYNRLEREQDDLAFRSHLPSFRTQVKYRELLRLESDYQCDHIGRNFATSTNFQTSLVNICGFILICFGILIIHFMLIWSIERSRIMKNNITIWLHWWLHSGTTSSRAAWLCGTLGGDIGAKKLGPGVRMPPFCLNIFLSI